MMLVSINLVEFSSILIQVIFVSSIKSNTISTNDLVDSKHILNRFNDDTIIKYDIILEMLVEQGIEEFYGTAHIDLPGNATVKVVKLSARFLNISTVSIQETSNGFSRTVVNDKSEELEIEYEYDRVYEILLVRLPASFQSDTIDYRITIKYKGIFAGDSFGLYTRSYNDENQEKQYLASSNYFPKYARQTFPCVDDPSYKGTFSITIFHGLHYVALSNMAINSSIMIEDNRIKTVFQASFPMSTYQVAISIVKFHALTNSVKGITYTIYSRTTQAVSFALINCDKIFEEIAKYLILRIPVKKIDFVAIPRYVDDNMVSFGLGALREESIHYDESETAGPAQIEVAIKIGQSIAHLWFGNYITPNSWNYLWINDGFARFMAYIAADLVFPYWNIGQYFLVSECHKALLVDGKESSIPISLGDLPFGYIPTQNPVLSSKVSCILQMYWHAYGESFFKETIQNYIQTEGGWRAISDKPFFYAYETTLKKSLLLRENVVEMFRSWIDQHGYPLVSVLRDYNSGYIDVSQIPFPTKNDDRSWWIPFNIVSATNPILFNLTLRYYELRINDINITIQPTDLEYGTHKDWIIVNSQQSGFYRVNYDDENWRLITEGLIQDLTRIHVNNRAQLLDDAFQLAQVNILTYETILNLSIYLKNEFEYAPWMAANSLFKTLRCYLEDHDEYYLFENYIRNITENFYQSHGFYGTDSDEHLLNITRGYLVDWSCRGGNNECLLEVKKIFARFLKTPIGWPIKIEPNLRSTILCHGLRNAAEEDLNLAFRILLNSGNRDWNPALLDAIGCSTDELFLRTFIETIVFDRKNSTFSYYERMTLITSLLEKGSVPVRSLMDVLELHYTNFNESTLPPDEFGFLKHTLTRISTNVYTIELYNQFENVIKGLTLLTPSEREELLSNSLENLKWIDNHMEVVLEWLRFYKNYQNDTESGEVEGSGSGEEICGCCHDTASTYLPSIFTITVLLFLSLRSIKYILM